MEKRAIIIGAGPAGLTAAYELLTRTDIKPIILEKSGDIGGISKTVNYKGNRIDIGGHRFFSKSDRVMDWWLKMMPIAQTDQQADTWTIYYQQQSREIKDDQKNSSPTNPDNVMLLRPRLSRIYFLHKFFSYPIQLSLDTLRKLGLARTTGIMTSYLQAQLFPRKPEKNLEDFMINRFGKVLYQLFFKDYTEKVWGRPCQEISAEWGAQRIKGISIRKAIQHAANTIVKKKKPAADIRQKDTETSLIEQFLYPKYGPGQLWEEVARQVQQMGGEIRLHQEVQQIYKSDSNERITAIASRHSITGETSYLEGDYFFSTMPVKELIEGMDGSIPDAVKHVASGLQYRDFITVGILLRKLSFQDTKTGEWKPLELKDTWIYIQEKEVKVGRLQLFNNWSPYMVKDPDTVWIGMEFFCNTDDPFWQMLDADIRDLAIFELVKMNLASRENILDATVLRMEKTYPAYFGTYTQFDVVQNFADQFENLFLVGRNGMHKYNNSDHSMLTAMTAVDNIAAGITSKENIWAINTEQEYHEEKAQVDVNDNAIPKEAAMPNEKPEESFFNYVFKQHKIALLIIVAGLLAQFSIFKWLFPFMNYIPDSYAYIEAAYRNSAINMWPVGYSKFLRVFSAVFQSDTVLALFQYLFLEGAVLYFLFTLFYWLRPNKTIRNTLLVFYTINPIFLLIGNYVLSDALFTGLSTIWITQLLWMTFRFDKRQLWIQAFLLLLLLTIRFNALYYPFITATVLLFTRISWKLKLSGLALSILFIGLFLWHNGNKYKELTGKRQFSGFGGWQLAANATMMLAEMDTTVEIQVPKKFAAFHQLVIKHRDSLNHLKKRPDTVRAIYYLWDHHAPVYAYMDKIYRKDTVTDFFKRWASMASFYGEYGRMMISTHPVDYVRFFLAENAKDYAIPPMEFISIYNMGFDSVGVMAKDFFGYKNVKVKAITKNVKAAQAYPVLFSVTNALFILGCIGFTFFEGFKKAPTRLKQALYIIALLWLGNFSFSVLAAPIVIRYQLLTYILFLPLGLLLFKYVLDTDKEAKPVKP